MNTPTLIQSSIKFLAYLDTSVEPPESALISFLEPLLIVIHTAHHVVLCQKGKLREGYSQHIPFQGTSTHSLFQNVRQCNTT
jgi:hypothetical protein